ncbi:hypothetical protein [Lihuaxuella thermophila]|uniref:hypothetical protein n=1 Tax=Lihuaxuella thermophila TaxID=1173111 RepID=UPI001114166E|nr:hypothetical protein [Lihuaxuella thermophila]
MKADRQYRIGKTTIEIIAPNITDEERESRINELQCMIRLLWDTLTENEKEKMIRKYNTENDEQDN